MEAHLWSWVISSNSPRSPVAVVVRRRLHDVSVMLDNVMTLECRAVVNKDPCESLCEVNVL